MRLTDDYQQQSEEEEEKEQQTSKKPDKKEPLKKSTKDEWINGLNLMNGLIKKKEA